MESSTPCSRTKIELWRTLSDTVGGTEALDKLRQASSGGELAATHVRLRNDGGGHLVALQEIGVAEQYL